MSKYFQDSFSHINESPQKTSNWQAEQVQISYKDSKTGAEYLLNERKPNGPQGDFRRPSISAYHQPEFKNRPDELETRSPEPAVSEAEIEFKVRQREQHSVKLSMASRPTSEPVQSDSWTDQGDYTVDPMGRIRDKPKNVMGLFGTEESRPEALPLVPEVLVKKPQQKAALGNSQSLTSGFAGPTRNLDPIEKKLSTDQKLQTLLSNAFRGLHSLQTQKGSKSESDKILGPEAIVLAKSIMDAGLLKPWDAPKMKGSNDRPQRPDDVAHAVGSRALQSLIKGPLAHDIQDLPKAERDDMSKALGRTILNALVAGPEQKSFEHVALADRPFLEEIKKSVILSISPNILNGLVHPELLSDRRPKDLQAVQRLTGPSQKEISAVPNRHTAHVSEKPEQIISMESKPVGLQNHGKKKNLFFMDDFEHSRPETREETKKPMRNDNETLRARSQHGSFSSRTEVNYYRNNN